MRKVDVKAEGAVLVTGGAGFIASHLIEALLRAKVPVVSIDNFDPFYARSAKEDNLRELKRIAKEAKTAFDFHEMDLNDLVIAQGGPSDPLARYAITRVIHLAAKAGVRPSLEDPQAYLRANVQGTLQLLEYCRVRGIRDMIFGSSSSVYGNETSTTFREDMAAVLPVSPYAATKRAGELYCATYAHLYQMKISCLRFFTVYGPRQRPDLAIHKFARQIIDGVPIKVFGDGSTERDYTHVSDIVTGIISALNWTMASPAGTYEIFNIGGSQTTSLKTLITLIEKSLGMKAKVIREPLQPGDVLRTCADVSKAERVLGYSPKIRPPEGIEDFASWIGGMRAPARKAA
jgi:UDP-glucuronate 4-epimerase